MTEKLKKSAAGAKLATGVTSQAKDGAMRSGHAMNEVVAAVGKIDDSSTQISQIVGVIDDIAFQTNLLALNAGVEAARAGEMGRGFAVIAQEVRELAHRSSLAAKEIKTLISNSSEQVKLGVKLVATAGGTLQDIVQQVIEINTLIGHLAASSEEQAKDLSQINSAIGQIDQIAQQNAAMVEEATAAAGTLRQAGVNLEKLVGRFRTGEDVSPMSRPTQSEARAPVPVLRAGGALPVTAPMDWEDF